MSLKHQGVEVTILRKKSYRVKTGKNVFLKQKKIHKNIQYSSHLLPRILPCRFVSRTFTQWTHDVVSTSLRRLYDVTDII